MLHCIQQVYMHLIPLWLFRSSNFAQNLIPFPSLSLTVPTSHTSLIEDSGKNIELNEVKLSHSASQLASEGSLAVCCLPTIWKWFFCKYNVYTQEWLLRTKVSVWAGLWKSLTSQALAPSLHFSVQWSVTGRKLNKDQTRVFFVCFLFSPKGLIT